MSLAAADLGPTETTNEDQGGPQVVKVLKLLKIAQLPISQETSKEQTASALQSLTPHEGQVIRMRFGIEDGRERTLEEVGQTFSVTRERIRQIEDKALRKLRYLGCKSGRS